jgi:hypothetical protein
MDSSAQRTRGGTKAAGSRTVIGQTATLGARSIGRLSGMMLCGVTAAFGFLQDAHGAELLTKPAKITFDQTGALVVDGQKIFPLNLTIIPPADAKAPNGKHAYAEFRDGGAIFMRTGGPRWDEKTLETELRYQEPAAKYGMRCCPWMGWEVSPNR